MEALESRYRSVRGRIPEQVVLIAASKTQPVEALEALYRLGHRDFGENYAQELLEKAAELESRGCSGIRWHFIGHLQTNKVKQLLPLVDTIHSVDSVKLAREISKRWLALRPDGCSRLKVFLEVNLDAEGTKSGVIPIHAMAVAAEVAALDGLELLGLMSIPAPRDNAEEARKVFMELRELEEKCRPHTRGQLSMGMSSDFEQAIAAGSTHVRVGTGIFGQRAAQG